MDPKPVLPAVPSDPALPQYKSSLTSLLIIAGTAVATWAAGHGFVNAGDQAALANGITMVLGMIVAIGTSEWKRRSQSQIALIKAVNDSDNGVKVVASSAPVAPVNTPLK